MSGKELSRAVRKINPNTPIILASGYSLQIDEVESENMGISAYFMKPVKLDILNEAIHKLVPQTRTLK